MAASRRSPLMRDQWRAEEVYRSHRDRREQDRTDRRRRSPASSRKDDSADVEHKIRGRATADSVIRTPPRSRDLDGGSRRIAETGSHRSLPAKVKGEEGSRQARETSPAHNKHRRPRSTTPEGRHRFQRQEPRRSRSPIRTERGNHSGARSRERAYSPRNSARRTYDSTSHRSRLSSPDRVVRDSYVPLPSSKPRRSRSPTSRNQRSPSFPRRRSRSPARRSRQAEDGSYRHQHIRRLSPRKISPRRARDSPSPYRYRESRLRASSSSKHRTSDKERRRSTSRSGTKTKRSYRSNHFSKSPERLEGEGRRMQSTTRPIQSILDDETARPPSPPRPIPSFDDSNGAGDPHLGQAFPMHGMKAVDIHPAHRRVPPHIDTRQSFAPSPQYMTPTSSHHGSPQSGSPYGHGRGGWAGQQQHFHGQPG